jgi:galactonate dehydratase
MKIRDIRTFPVRVGRGSTSGSRAEFRYQLVVKVDTDEGVSGVGESGLSGREQAVVGAIAHLTPLLVGRDPMLTGALWQELYRSTYFESDRATSAAISAIDMALHDIKGKALGVPVYQLLGGKQRDHVPLFATTEAPMGPRLIQDARKLLDAGWNVIRTWIHAPDEDSGGTRFEPRESIGPTATWLTKLREAVGPDPVLGIDYHHRLSVAEAASFCQRLPPGTLDFLEEPIRDETPDAYAALRSMVEVPFAIGEEFQSKWQFLPYVERGLTQFARVDLCNVGGFTEAMKIAGWCEAHYIDLMPHNPLGPVCTAASVHLAAAVPNFAWLEYRNSPTEDLAFYDPEVFPVQVRQDGPRLLVPDAPGLGVEFDENAAARDEYRVIPQAHLRRDDGSVTNW